MSDPTATAERREEILGELAEWMHAAAREAQRRLLEAETTDDFVKLTGSLAKLARGVRQSILIHRKLEAERLEAERLAGEAAAREPELHPELIPRHVKRVRLRTAITRHVWNELEDDEEAELFRDDLNARLDEMEGEDDFLDTPIDDLIARLCRDLGFAPPLTSPVAAATAGGGPAAEERLVEGASLTRPGPAVHAPNTS
ncbi:hypothetical protein [Phenylobacterium sp.]|uniref:hypothetical protein n=1 Tax=Phenylobacterium sp. TaxID=1871053 RepID=UPI002C85C67A|nr:hypothetical protein [Phenylobacterium sp.]HLZ73454.1 hypothetical protein [Phenylobacterium sp.]